MGPRTGSRIRQLPRHILTRMQGLRNKHGIKRILMVK